MKAKTVFIVLSILGVGAIAVWFFSQRSNKHLKLIPKDALIVGTADWAALAKKADFAKLRELEFFKTYQEDLETEEPEINRHLQEIVNNPTSTGINLLSEMYFYVTNLENVNYNVAVVAINDVARFERMLMGFDHTMHIQVGYNCHYLSLDNTSVLAWDDETAMIAIADSYRLQDNWQRMFAEWTYGQLPEQTMKEHAVFDDLMDEDRDVKAFINGPAVLRMMKREYKGEASFIPKNLAILEDNYMMMGLNFGDDDISLDLNLYNLNPEYEKLKEIGMDGISEGHMSLLSNQAVSTAILALRTDKTIEYLNQHPESKKELTTFLESIQMSETDFASAFSGEYSFNWYGFLPRAEPPKERSQEELALMTPEEYYAYVLQFQYYRPRPSLSYVFNFSSNNKGAVRSLVERKMPETNIRKSENGNYSMPLNSFFGAGTQLYLVENPIGFSLTNDSLLIEKLMNGNMGGPIEPAREIFDNKSMGAYYNFQIVNDTASATSKELFDMLDYRGEMRGATSVIEGISIYLGLEKSEAKIKLQSGPDNSLHQLIAHFGRIGKLAEEEAKKMREQYKYDTWDGGSYEEYTPPPAVEDVYP